MLSRVGADASRAAVVARRGDGGSGDASVGGVAMDDPPLQLSSARAPNEEKKGTHESREVVVEDFAVPRLALERGRKVLEFGVVLGAEGLKEGERVGVTASLVDEGGDDLEGRDPDDHVVCAVDLAARESAICRVEGWNELNARKDGSVRVDTTHLGGESVDILGDLSFGV